MKKLIILIVIIVLVGGLGFWGPLNHERFSHHTVMEEYAHHDYSSNAEHNSHALSPIDTSAFIKVHSAIPDVKNFFTQHRTSEIISFPCQNCHNKPLEELKLKESDKAIAHWDIDMQHASAAVMNCSTCHQGNNMDMLKTLGGESISLDMSYKLCGQCHSSQYKDWQGGAHGKNISGWNSTRVTKTCVSCHNPHDPEIKPRWPSRLINNESE